MSEKRIRQAILDLTAERGAGKTVCPSEIARIVKPEDWRSLMGPIRQVAHDLLKAGKIRVTQRGKNVEPLTAKGPVRLGLGNTTSKPVR